MSMDVAALRKGTPALPGLAHFNAASSGLVPSEVVEVLQLHLAEEVRTSPHAAGLAAAEAIENARDEIAWLIGASAPEIAFTTGNSEGWNLALLSMPRFRPGDRILVGGGEWGGNILTLAQECAAAGARLERIPELPDGRMDLSGLEEMIDDRLRLIAVTWVGAHLGHAAPVARIGQLARAAGVPFLLDAAQAVGVLPVDVNRIGCDVLSAAGRKGLRGPKGSGFLFVREGFLEELMPRPMNLRAASLVAGEVVQRRDGGRFEAAEFAPALRLGLGAAVRLANRLGAEAIRDRVLTQTDRLRAALAGVPGLVLRESGPAESHITTFFHPRIAPEQLQLALAQRGVTINTVNTSYAPFSTVPMPQGAVCRASVSYLTNAEEIARLTAALQEIVQIFP
ncbi:aminotransferase class V-fold PLP-dependent enzyme [Pseudooceanicola sp. 200-1SW]|uniref:aminotransferase class V-fold PLP-dependent enzyme n=1 Tax=Pseudooceanicola sp. 200-1SW TaxID=3425949 RepID=UPI003D7F9463